VNESTTPVGATPVRYVCMPGSSYTGSSLLGALLNEHPDCVSIGAATGLIRRVDLSTYRCSCGRLFNECEFWRDIAARTQALGHPVNVFKTDFWNTNPRLAQNRILNAPRLKGVGENCKDRSWQTRLSGTNLETIKRIAGPANRRLGVTWQQ
jgi:hypothetical protein